jgi:hypothetical protein
LVEGLSVLVPSLLGRQRSCACCLPTKTPRLRRLLLGAALGSLAPALALGGTFNAFGPETYRKAIGTPAPVVKNFSVLNPAAPYLLRVHNGSPQFPRVASGSISINGVQVVRAQDLNFTVTLVEKPVTLQASNQISVLIRGQATSGIIVEIIGTDNDAPTITAQASPPPNANGWNRTDVTVTFTCADATSGIASCTAPITVTTEGAGQVVSGTAVDKAGNSASASVTLNIDKTPPLLQVVAPVDGSTVTSSPVAASGTASDALSGLEAVLCNGAPATLVGSDFTCSVPVVEGDNTIGFEARDVAGNTTPASRSVRLETGGGDTVPPEIHITSPAGGSFVFQGRPPIDLTYSDAGGIDLSTLVLTVNGGPLAADCALTPTGGRCTPFTPVPDGSVTIGASIKDLAGNTGSTGVTFTIDTAPVGVHIDSPENGLITRDLEVTVQGTVGDGVTDVEVNGVTASLSAPGFSATVPLRQGTNMLVAVARKANGKTGTHSVDVTQDLVAPIVRIDSPRNGFVSTTDLITVTGLVNDVVNGGRDAVVTVNGLPAPVAAGSFMLMDLKLVRGPNHIEAVGTDFVGNVGRHSIDVSFEPPVGLRMTMVSGNGQEGPVREPVPQPLVVVIKDDRGNPAAGRVVHFQVTRNNATLSASAGDPPARVVEVPTDGSGRASVLLTLGDTTGEGTNRVTATAVGVAGEVEFCANGRAAPADKILMTMGDNQRGAVGQPLATPLEALVVDRNGNPIAGVDVTFRVVLGNGNLDGQPTAVRTTGTDGLVRAVVTLSLEGGINNNVVHATFEGLEGLPAAFTASGLVPGDPAATSFSGVVLDNGHTPIPGTIVTIPGTPLSATTDAEGQFLLLNVPVGHIHLRINPATSPRPEKFPPLEFETVTVAGQRNVLGQPILIPAINPNCTVVGGPQDVTVPMLGVPGLNLTVFANSVTARDGSHTACITISQVHLDKVPMAPPSGTIFMPPAWTVQPAGTHFNPPARITIPNDGMPAGRMIDIFQFDHDLNQFINVGKGTTTEDGLMIVSDPGFGISSAGWGGCGQPQPPTTCKGKPCTDSDPKDCVDISGNTCDPGGCKKTNKPPCTTCGATGMNVCTKDGQCIDFPTVALSFRNSGSVSADNSAGPANGISTLGLINSPKFKNNEEVQGTISPAGFTCATYDIKRNFKTAGEVILNGTVIVSKPAGSSDDAHNGDEDLTPMNDHIYGLDGPSPGIGPSSPGTEGDVLVQRAKFTEWVECTVNGKTKKCSSDLDWCFIITLKYTGGTWGRNGANSIQMGTGCY